MQALNFNDFVPAIVVSISSDVSGEFVKGQCVRSTWQGVKFASIGALIGLFLLQQPVVAHDVVISSNPQDGAKVTEFPTTVELTFSGIPKKDFNTVALSRKSDSTVLYRGEPHLNGQVVSFTLPSNIEKQAGEYLIGFQITSSDGHSTKGRTTFTYVDPSQENGSSEVSAESELKPTTSEGLSSTVTFAAGGITLIALAIVSIFLVARRNSQKGK